MNARWIVPVLTGVLVVLPAGGAFADEPALEGLVGVPVSVSSAGAVPTLGASSGTTAGVPVAITSEQLGAAWAVMGEPDPGVGIVELVDTNPRTWVFTPANGQVGTVKMPFTGALGSTLEAGVWTIEVAPTPSATGAAWLTGPNAGRADFGAAFSWERPGEVRIDVANTLATAVTMEALLEPTTPSWAADVAAAHQEWTRGAVFLNGAATAGAFGPDVRAVVGGFISGAVTNARGGVCADGGYYSPSYQVAHGLDACRILAPEGAVLTSPVTVQPGEVVTLRVPWDGAYTAQILLSDPVTGVMVDARKSTGGSGSLPAGSEHGGPARVPGGYDDARGYTRQMWARQSDDGALQITRPQTVLTWPPTAGSSQVVAVSGGDAVEGSAEDTAWRDTSGRPALWATQLTVTATDAITGRSTVIHAGGAASTGPLTVPGAAPQNPLQVRFEWSAPGIEPFVENFVVPAAASDKAAAMDDEGATRRGQPIRIAVLDNDVNVLAVGEVARVIGDAGTLELLDDTIVFTPRAEFTGRALMSYRGTSAVGLTAPAIVAVDVLPDPPVVDPPVVDPPVVDPPVVDPPVVDPPVVDPPVVDPPVVDPPVADPPVVDPPVVDRLAATGGTLGALGVLAALVAATGALMVVASRRRGEPDEMRAPVPQESDVR